MQKSTERSKEPKLLFAGCFIFLVRGPWVSLKANNNYNPVNLHEFFKLIERRHATRKFSSALFRVLLALSGRFIVVLIASVEPYLKSYY